METSDWRGLESLGWTAREAEDFAELAEEGSYPARVLLEHQHIYRVHDGERERLARIAGKLRHEFTSRREYPAVGDWVAVRDAPQGDEVVIETVLPRRSRFLRKLAGKSLDAQVVAANVDTVFVVSGLDGDFNPRRIERYLVTAFDSGARPVMVLNKADVCQDLELILEFVEMVAPGTPVHVVSGLTGQGVDELRQYAGPGEVVAFVGASGVGKSTLINRLLGEERLETAPVRETDSRGRHTTRHRQMLALPEGGLLIDTPGMRELQLWEGAGGLEEAFPDIVELAARCRFPDCSHGEEPGCAVREAIEEGDLDPDRFESYQRLRREAAVGHARPKSHELESRRRRRGKPPRPTKKR